MRTRIALILVSPVIAFAGCLPLVALADTAASTPACGIFVHSLSIGTTDARTGGEVTLLQQLLAKDSSIYPEGIVSGYFGALTMKAVKRWQAAHNIAQLGLVGPLTRAALACKVVPPVTPPSTPSTTPQVPPVPPAPTSTPPAAVVPTCTLTTDKDSYSFGDHVEVTWTTTNATSVTFPLDTSGALQLPFLGTYTPQGSLTVTANVSGSPSVTLVANGQNSTATCKKTVTVSK